MIVAGGATCGRGGASVGVFDGGTTAPGKIGAGVGITVAGGTVLGRIGDGVGSSVDRMVCDAGTNSGPWSRDRSKAR